ncbi:autotransporter domain-containing protein [Bradyrhizobium sp. U87765 SZCCT0131]|uniref:autotransporter outer membrane beta-barrel domain-containing protein n=1 Tax=unclassified Bradyrhizobium TaxID=2631580 RepID=UPI001BA449E5|nr:autotransporter domain-containing protein [Bradyrhizobium sp. U87765 SZCCT0131]MBR1259610.1 autotransporter domain-containing protein [Bradyrhizobium sp. U87765 SZCCT0134]MBR1305751.1 autotransporter domain-containing protein [Bradyrhizobium sp. U87765 SZCCT0110]MBR1322118.1 autotransporter domain-containing protein [Bradyrhizobium sp. U87765 SZCCT0109]MBR1350604.1 autotransporter domain-containing protein [Bradyrhizobium sp. U87765 SZCCT0048]
MLNLTSTAVYGRRVSLAALLALLSGLHPAAALDAQWLANPASAEFNEAANWMGGAVPTGSAIFGASTRAAVTITPDGALALGGIQLGANAPAYTFGLSTGTLTLNGTGVAVNGGSATFNVAVGGSMFFTGGSSAGSASYVVSSVNLGLAFYDTSSAGNAVITNNGSQIVWADTASAGNATITNNNGIIAWQASSTAGNATVINNSGTIGFLNNATAGNARLVANGGSIDFSMNGGPQNDGRFTAGSIEGAGRFVLGGGQLTVGGNNLSTTVSGAITDCAAGDGCLNVSSGGSLVKVGTGTLTLTGTNTYSGGTTVNAGTLAVAGNASLGAAGGGLTFGGGTLQALSSFNTNRQVLLNTGGGTIDTNGNTVSFAGPITGDGGLTKTGAGTLLLGGANDYNGDTTINGGTLAVIDDVNLGNSARLVFNGGTLQLTTNFWTNRDIVLNAAGATVDTMANNVALSGAISGDGGLTKIGTGTLTLDGVSTYTGPTSVMAGLLVAGRVNALSAASTFTVASGAALDIGGRKQTIGALAGAGLVQNSGEPAATLTLGANGTNTVFSGVIADGLAPLSLVKTGAGTQVLNGRNTYSGTTTVQGGKLVVGDDSHPAASIAGRVTLAGGTLGGIGTVGGVAVASGARVAPGNSIGTLNVAGNVSFAAGSFYDVELNAGGQSDRIAASGTAKLAGGSVNVIAETGSYRSGTRYTILTANGGVTGTFASLTQSFPFLQFALSYDPTNVYLDVTRSQATFPSVAITPNQVATARATEALRSGAIYDAVVQQPGAAGARQAFDALSGEVQASARMVMIEDSRFVREAAIDRLRSAFDGVAVASAPAMAYASADPAAARAGDAIAMWARGFGAWGSASGNGNAAGLARDIGGLFAGGDARVAETWRLGVLGGYSHSTLRIADRMSSGASDNYHVAGYAGTQWGSLAFRSGAAFTWHDITTSRTVSFAGFGDMLRGDQQARTTQVFGELGYRIDAGRRVMFEPFANLAYVNLSTDGFTERGGAAALAVAGDRTAVTFTTLGLRAEHHFSFIDGPDMAARATLGWRHAFGDVTPLAIVAFGGGSPFGVAGLPIGRDAAIAGAGLDVNLTKGAVLGIAYDGQFDSRLSDQSVKANFRVTF